MCTLFIIIFICITILAILALLNVSKLHLKEKWDKLMICLCFVSSIALLVLAASAIYFLATVPDEYVPIKGATIVETEISFPVFDETIYKKDNRYYIHSVGKAKWIPFAKGDFVEIEFPDLCYSKD